MIPGLVILTALLYGGIARADIYRVIGKGNTIAPLRSSEIAMDAETVLVEPESDFGGFQVSAVFTMRNTSNEPVECDVAFPFESQGSARNAQESFKVRIGEGARAFPVSRIDLKVRGESVTRAPRLPHDFAAALVWQVQWAARETKTIHVDYKMGEPEEYQGFVEGWRVRYIVRTGALWKGPIGRADITVRLNGNRMFADDFAQVGDKPHDLNPPFSYPKHANRVSPTEIAWHFEKWTPEEDVWLGVIRWAGVGRDRLGRLFIRLPVLYAGATTAYNDALLESIVDRELEPWRESFPAEAERERVALKALVAEFLYREMFARHGDPFYLGKHKTGEPAPPNSRGYDQNDNYLSVWGEKFPLKRRGRGGWYEPGTGPGSNGSVRLSDLTEQERRNAEFLQRYFSLP
jgi:hypothetical protein